MKAQLHQPFQQHNQRIIYNFCFLINQRFIIQDIIEMTDNFSYIRSSNNSRIVLPILMFLYI